MNEIPQDIPVSLREPSNKLPSTNPLGAWVDGFALKRNMAIRIFGDDIGLPGISLLRRREPHEISLYSIQQLLEHVGEYDPSDVEIDSLADAVDICLGEAVRVKGRIYDRLPPTVARSKQKGIDGLTYTVNQFAVKYNVSPSKAQRANRALGLNTLFTQEDADRILEYIKDNDERKAKNGPTIKGFASVFSETTGVSERNFTSEVSNFMGFDKGVMRAIKQGRNPTPEEFGRILESFKLTDDQAGVITKVWLDIFRKSIRLGDVGAEYGISRERVRQIAIKVGYTGNQNWGWDAAEAVRAYKDNSQKGRSKKSINFSQTENIDLQSNKEHKLRQSQRGRKKQTIEDIISSFESGKPFTTRQLAYILEAKQPTDEQVERLVGIWLPQLRNSISYTMLGNEYKVTGSAIYAQAKKMGLTLHEGSLSWEDVEAIRRGRNIKAMHAKTSPSISRTSSVVRKTQSAGTTSVTESRVYVTPKEIAEPKNRPEYPNVLSSEYLSSLVEAERNGASKLRGSSFSNPIKLDELSKTAVEYLMKERIFPQNASIRKRKGDDGSDYYYFDYHLRPMR